MRGYSAWTEGHKVLFTSKKPNLLYLTRCASYQQLLIILSRLVALIVGTFSHWLVITAILIGSWATNNFRRLITIVDLILNNHKTSKKGKKKIKSQ